MPSILMVTGASRGIGAAVARAAGAAGYDVCVNYHSNEALARAVVADIEKAGQRAIAVQADTGSEAEIERLFETCDRELG
ncbi:MAG: SDR family NAD(P)-dependent oxidoreductase, partial [Rhodospirillales bacterium]|nr:SDR family NAD(P)-dependent oxidoreductase [Rhodospirillales bacterium]